MSKVSLFSLLLSILFCKKEALRRNALNFSPRLMFSLLRAGYPEFDNSPQNFL
jgi:hypothetical protein